MRSLLRFLALCAAAALCVCYDSHESTESAEDLFVHPNQANSFMVRQRGIGRSVPRGNSFGYASLRRKIKSPAERWVETCEDISPCRYYAHRFGYLQAYNRYLGAQNQQQRAAMTRRY